MGWLGWTAEAAETTPIPLIELALDERVKWWNATVGGKGGGGGRQGRRVSGGDAGGIDRLFGSMARRLGAG